MQRSTLMIILLAAAIVICTAVLAFLLSPRSSSLTPFLTSRPEATATPVGTGSGTGQAPTSTPTSSPFTDPSHLFSLTLPDGWNVTESHGARGLSVFSLSAQSPDFSSHTDESTDGPFIPQYYDQGARLSLNAMRGPQNPAPRGSEPIIIDGVTGWFDDTNAPSTTQGQDLAANVVKDGITYAFYYSYNSDTYPEGEHVFREILDSFIFL